MVDKMYAQRRLESTCEIHCFGAITSHRTKGDQSRVKMRLGAESNQVRLASARSAALGRTLDHERHSAYKRALRHMRSGVREPL